MVTKFNALLRHFGLRGIEGWGREKEREKEKERKRQNMFEFLTDECFSDHNERIRSIQIDKNFITQIGQFRSTRNIARLQANTSKKLLKMAKRTKFNEISMHKDRSSLLRKEITSEAVLQLVEHAADFIKREKKKKLIEKFYRTSRERKSNTTFGGGQENAVGPRSSEHHRRNTGIANINQGTGKRAKFWPRHEHP